MSDRQFVETPAMGVAILMGLVLIVAGSVGLYFIDDGTDYDVVWSHLEAGSASAELGSGANDQAVVIQSDDMLISNMEISSDNCADSAQAPVQGAVSVSWAIVETVPGATEMVRNVGSGSATCAELAADGPFVISINPIPDVATVTAESLDEARGMAETDAGFTDATYTITFSWERADGSVPALPVPGTEPTFSATIEVMATTWAASIQEEGEVIR